MSAPRSCILSVAGETLRPDEQRFLQQSNPWGIILMGRSVKTREQVRVLVDEIWSALGRACLVFIDQEGGRVRRMRPPEWPDFPAAGSYSRLYDIDDALGVEASWLGHRLMASELAPMGLHANCAPVLDVLHQGAHQIIGDRAFGETPEKVALLAQAALDGLSAGGVAGVIKHVPGHGRALADSHESLPVVTADAESIAIDVEPFAHLKHAPMAMTAHVAYEVLDGKTPATISPTIINTVIRDRIGFEGLLMSDDLGMKALGGSLYERAGKALQAGCDIALHCAGFEPDPNKIIEEMQEVADAAPPLEGRSLKAAENAIASALREDEFDIAAGWRRFEDLLTTDHPEALA